MQVLNHKSNNITFYCESWDHNSKIEVDMKNELNDTMPANIILG